MNTQCRRCLSSLFPRVGKNSCTYCDGYDVTGYTPDLDKYEPMRVSCIRLTDATGNPPGYPAACRDVPLPTNIQQLIGRGQRRN